MDRTAAVELSVVANTTTITLANVTASGIAVGSPSVPLLGGGLAILLTVQTAGVLVMSNCSFLNNTAGAWRVSEVCMPVEREMRLQLGLARALPPL